MGLVTICKEDVPEYLKQSAFYQALDNNKEDRFTISMTHFKTDAVVTDANSFRDLLHTLRFWGVDIIPTSVCDAAFNDDCLCFIPVASDFKAELRYLDELIQLRKLPLENRLEHACGYGNLQIIRNIVGSNSDAISRVCFEAAARGGHMHVIRFLHSFRCRKHWSRISDVAATKGHLSCVKYVFKRTKSFFNAAYDAAKHGHVNILRFIAQHDGKLEKVLCEVCLPHLEVVQCLYESNVPWPSCYTSTIVRHNALPVLRFALSHGCPMHPSTLSEAHSVECVQILIEVGGYQLDEHSMSLAAEAGLEIMRYVHAQDCPLTLHTALRAAQYNQTELLRYLHAQHCPWNGQCIHEAELHGSYESLVYMYEQGCDVPLLYRDNFLNPSSFSVSSRRWNSTCMKYLRSQFDYTQQRFIGRNEDGSVYVESLIPVPVVDDAAMVELTLVSTSCYCVIQ